MKNKRGAILTFLVVILGAGCSKSGTTPGGPNSPSGVQGNWTETQVLPSNDTSMYTVGCKTPGNSEPLPQIDQRLQSGMVFDTLYQIVDGPGSGLNTGEVNFNVVSVNATTLVEQMTLLAGNFFGFPIGTSTTETCTLDNTGNFNCVFNPDVKPPNEQCTIEIVSADPDKKSSGTFTTVAGQVYSGFKTVSHYSGKITCGSVDEGTGTGDITIITSNDAPAEGTAEFCGGSPLYLNYTLTKGDGTPLMAVSTERKSIH